jgi:hypothetical protein
LILFEITGNEHNSPYQELAIANVNRQFDFLKSIVLAAIAVDRGFLSHNTLKALNFHAIACLHVSAGEYRPCPVKVGEYVPPEHYRVNALMDEFINYVNLRIGRMDPVVLAAFVLWKLNYIHPFINGNGRTARAACYFILCLASGGWIEGEPILPQLLDRDHEDYVAALRSVDASLATGTLDLSQLHALISKLLKEQIEGANEPANTPPIVATPDAPEQKPQL